MHPCDTTKSFEKHSRGSTWNVRVVEWGKTAWTQSKQPARKINHKDPFVPILGHPVLFTRAAAQSLLSHLGPVFIARKEKHFQMSKTVSIRLQQQWPSVALTTVWGVKYQIQGSSLKYWKGYAFPDPDNLPPHPSSPWTGPVKKFIHLRSSPMDS